MPGGGGVAAGGRRSGRACGGGDGVSGGGRGRAADQRPGDDPADAAGRGGRRFGRRGTRPWWRGRTRRGAADQGGGRARPQRGDRVRADHDAPAGLPGPTRGQRAPAGRGPGGTGRPVLAGSGSAVRPRVGPRLVHRRRRRGRVRHRGPDRHPADHRADPGRGTRRRRVLRRPQPHSARRCPGRRCGDHRGRQGCPGPARGTASGHRQARRQGQGVRDRRWRRQWW